MYENDTISQNHAIALPDRWRPAFKPPAKIVNMAMTPVSAGKPARNVRH